MITPEFVLNSAILVILALLLLFAVFRLRNSAQATVFHLAAYIGLLFGAYLARLMELLALVPPPAISYGQLSTLGLLATILAFGALSLSLLRVNRAKLMGYWFGAAAILAGWGVSTVQLPPADGAISIPFALEVVGWVAALAGVYAGLIHALRQQPSSKHRNRLRYWLIATTLHFAAGLILLSDLAIFWWTGSPLLIIGSVLAGYVVLRYHTPDLNRVIGRAMHYFGVSSLLAAIFYLALSATVIFSRSNIDPINILFWLVVLALLLALSAPPLWRVVYRLLNRIIFGRKDKDEKEIIRHFSRSISSALDMQRLGDILITLMTETFNLEHGVVFINDRGTSSRLSLRPMAWNGPAEPTPFQFATDSLFVNYFRDNHKFVFQYDLEVLPEFRHLAPAERAWLTSLGAELYVPILRARDIMGLLAFGSRPQKSSYYHEDVDLAVALADEAVLAIDSARLFEQLATINQEMGALSEQLAGLDQNKSDFLSIASHELRTPLTHIHGYSRMLLDLSEEEAKDFAYVKTIVAGIAKGSERLKNIIDMMFDVTEANVGEMNLFLGPVDLKEIVRQASGPFLTALDERRIAFETKGFTDMPVIEADGNRLVQALENLLSNAIKYTPNGGKVTIEGRAIVVDHIGSAVEFVVTDTGVGINPEHHERIFEKFFRVDDTDHHSTGRTKFKGAGPGLGLTLVKGIVEAHGGRVWVQSDRHDEKACPGSKFFMVIPLHPVAPVKKKSRKQSQIETVRWDRKLILPTGDNDDLSPEEE